ncbi:uncharacterized protein [Dermacentor andersoni]|uniref:uncharacterized protein n=1 Tax=Dermacentor andersoni TaxID=34620 RepID=UPI002416FA8E|nr:TNF receptor-associated factor 6-like [Dermacentor andersoni]
MPDHGRGRVHRFRDHVVSGVNWRPTRFLDDVPSSRVCSLCRMIPKRTVLLPCGHALCQSCHAASLAAGVGRCPLDQEPFEEAECVGYEFPARKANAVRVYCWNEAHGCEYTGTMDRMLEHYENECTFHTVDCLRCGEGVQHKDLPTHYAAGCPARVPSAITESSEHTALTLPAVNAALEDVKVRLACLNHDQLLPVIQSQLNELTEQARNQEARLAGITRELGLQHQRTSQQTLGEEDSTPTSLSLRSEKALILRKLEHIADLEHLWQTSPKPDSSRVIAHCETLYNDVRHLISALPTTATRIREIGSVVYVLTLENCDKMIRSQTEARKFAEITVWHMRDAYFTLAVWRSLDFLHLKIEFSGMLVDSKCLPPIWSVSLVDHEGLNGRLLTSRVTPCSCRRSLDSMVHFHLEFSTDIAVRKYSDFIRGGKIKFHILLNNTEMDGGITGLPERSSSQNVYCTAESLPLAKCVR